MLVKLIPADMPAAALTTWIRLNRSVVTPAHLTRPDVCPLPAVKAYLSVAAQGAVHFLD